MKQLVIAIDGYSSCGKSTTAKAVAALLHYAYVDTGAMYRGVTLYLLEQGIDFGDLTRIEQALREISISFRRNRRTGRNELFLNGANREDDIRQMRISNSVSEVSVIPMVRHAMVAQQQQMGRKRGVVMDGRDIGTTVFPDAEVKIFMTAEVELRARRRQEELAAKGEHVPLEDIIENLRKRDYLDSTRAESPLRRAADAVLLDTTHITITEQVDFVLDRVSSALFAAGWD
ncbi:(d)CMP kinase [Hymenobacter negativus]|uniref:Cytidylate kinase n=1 Tax=Hymenobacter negativus TaxID=2795026 RepID=A0ABS0Q4L8_9BACT|nr:MULTISPECIES: (d)CMP kinase [Bacteria]MBH8557427.1 (d)CMP kinase [Hymenobacter negativus]MBH8568040.1 (d)CMP kinase [Hymenobacter negativus]MBR7207776.1 (d)CMP kinase [Microvirga sp. STS02]